jgi:dolichyl-phosphate-mannose-protein mannosyltransferase
MRLPLGIPLKRPELLVLTALALLTRFWGLLSPGIVVWDEVHFLRYASAYFTGQYYVDVHPPLGKLLMAGEARLLGVSGAALAAADPAPVLRLLPALAGALIIPVVWLLLRELGVGRRVATLAAALLLVDNGLVVESRYYLMDSMLLLFGMAAVLFYVMARGRSGRPRWALLGASALAAGMAASTKWTGLSALGLIGLAWIAEAVIRRRGVWVLVREGLVLVLVPAAVYLGSFAVHFSLLRKAGPGESWMSPQFRATLEGSRLEEFGAPREPFLRSFLDLNRTMGSINIAWATDRNPLSSPWYTWPIAKHSLRFWGPMLESEDPQRWIILFANPVVWWGALFGMLATAVGAARRREAFVRHRRVLAFLAAGYAINFIPFAFITRPMYLYHYFFALIFSLMIGAVGVGVLMGWMDDEVPFWRFPARRSLALYVAVIGLASTTFLYLAPMSYGWSLSAKAVLHRRWLLERHVGV